MFHEYGAGDLVEVGLGLATIGLVTGVVVGTILVNHAIKSPSIPVARQNPTTPDEDLDIDHHLPRPDQEPMDEWQGMSQARQTGVVRGYSYRQMFTRPLIGGGFISALSIPFIAALGLPIFTILAVVMTVGLTIWGLRRAALGQSEVQSAS